MKKFKDYLLEGFLIVFSVLFALFIQNYAEGRKTDKQKVVALERIKREIERNAKVLSEWLPHHQGIHARLTNAVENKNDSLRIKLSLYNLFNFGVLTNDKQIIQTLLGSTAWETARTTGIINEFDFELVEHLTQTYFLQNTLMTSVNGIAAVYFEASTHDLKNLDTTLKQLEIRFQEITGQENFLNEAYRDVLMKLN